MTRRHQSIAERRASRTNRLIHLYALAGAYALMRIGTDRYNHAQARAFRLYLLLPESLQRVIKEAA